MNPNTHDLKFSFRVPGGVSSLQVENRYWLVRFDFEIFPGGMITMEEELTQGQPLKKFRGRLEDVAGTGMILGWRPGMVGVGTQTDEIYRLDEDELEWVKFTQKVISWAQDNSFIIDIVDENPQLAELELLGPAPTALDAELSIVPI